MLTGMEILKQVKDGRIVISDFDPSRLNPNSYNLRLGNHFMEYKLGDNNSLSYLDSKKENSIVDYYVNQQDGIILQPNRLYLASTMETTWAKDLVPCISGRSSFARLGVEIHKTAGFGDIGVELNWTLEIEVVHPVKIYPGQEICQIYFEEPVGDTTMQYNGKYQGSTDVVMSKAFEDYQHILDT